MYKQILVSAVSAFAALTMMACGNNSNNARPQPAAVPQPVPMTVSTMQTKCLRAATQETWWDMGQYKIQPYATPASGFNLCGCPIETMPTCSAQGLVCVPMVLMNNNVAVWSWASGQNGPAFQPNNAFVNPYQSYYGRGPRAGQRRGPRPERVPAQAGQCPQGYVLDRDGSTCFVMRRWGPGPRGGVYAYAYTYGFTFTHGGPPMGGGSPNPAINNSCTISSIAQICDVIPGQGPINGMFCQPLSPGNPKGIWVQNQ